MAADEEPDPELRIIDNPAQRRAFDRCMGYINATNSAVDHLQPHLPAVVDRESPACRGAPSKSSYRPRDNL
jgi:hypothetical protein